jgi:acyl carrier protein
MKEFCHQLTVLLDQDVSPGTNYRDIENWGSLSAVMVMGMIKDMYDVDITDSDIRNNKTVRDLYKIVKNGISKRS